MKNAGIYSFLLVIVLMMPLMYSSVATYGDDHEMELSENSFPEDEKETDEQEENFEMDEFLLMFQSELLAQGSHFGSFHHSLETVKKISPDVITPPPELFIA